MKTVSIRELHEATGAWVRKAARLGALTVTDRGKAVARITAVGEEPRENPFRARKLRPGYARLRGKLGGGTDSTQILAGDRAGR
jgi:antitoxin (DNA-binding transcriptional repressor) of toxin-antitoxin stability system